MRCISSQSTFFYKHMLPVTSLGFAVLLAVFTFTQGVEKGVSAIVMPIAALLLFAGLTFALFKRMTFELADEVYDEGESLVVRSDSRTDRIAFSNIVSIFCSRTMKLPRVTVTLRNPGAFGTRFVFIAANELISARSDAGIDALILRVNASHAHAGRSRPPQRPSLSPTSAA